MMNTLGLKACHSGAFKSISHFGRFRQRKTFHMTFLFDIEASVIDSEGYSEQMHIPAIVLMTTMIRKVLMLKMTIFDDLMMD
mmetsp:Transcript_8138/g.19657  ORF Transcript_8138/g.19657 Transcript_8138/m.19657 type:complete len:82 (-) Transcript_8138:832-1077(-)